MDDKKKQAIIRSIAMAIESEQDAYDFIEELKQENWSEWLENTYSTARWKKQHCVICKKEYLGGDGPCTGLCSECYRTKNGINIISKLSTHRGRARDAGLPFSLTLREWYSTLDHFHHLCAYCKIVSYTAIEHFVPIVLGGGTTKGNCVPSCSICNLKKKNKHPQDVANRFPQGAIDRISLYLCQFQ